MTTSRWHAKSMTPDGIPVNPFASALPFFSAPSASLAPVSSVLPAFLGSRGAQARPPFSRSQTSSCGLQAFEHSRLHPELSLWSAAAALRWRVAPFIVRDRNLSSGPYVIAGLALTLSANCLFARVTRFKDADPGASAFRAFHRWDYHEGKVTA